MLDLYVVRHQGESDGSAVVSCLQLRDATRPAWLDDVADMATLSMPFIEFRDAETTLTISTIQSSALTFLFHVAFNDTVFEVDGAKRISLAHFEHL